LICRAKSDRWKFRLPVTLLAEDNLMSAALMPMPARSVQPSTHAAGNPWDAVVRRDRSFDGVLFYAVKTTGIYCKPSCPSRRPRPANVEFFFDARQAERAGFRPCRRCHPRLVAEASPEVALIRRTCEFIERNLDGTLTSSVLRNGLPESPAQVNRVFRRTLGVTVREYIEARRFALFKLHLGLGRSVAEATYDAGYGSSRGAYEGVTHRLGMTPAVYREGAHGQQVRYAIVQSSLGLLLIAATAKGLCRVAFGESERQLEAELEGEFRHARLQRDENAMSEFADAVSQLLDGQPLAHVLPVDIQTTAFQRRVYRELQKIPAGQTRSYQQIARSIGQPSACRAVARACASNPVAVMIPCHRVVRSDGELSGYRWGADRKQRLLDAEKRVMQARQD
jgi:AraC family transcriptional regulator of adaptative response/methylated-DNA-[protein]-cysteine methyltransferase